MTSLQEKGGGTFRGIKLLLCENPLPPLDEAIAAAIRLNISFGTTGTGSGATVRAAENPS